MAVTRTRIAQSSVFTSANTNPIQHYDVWTYILIAGGVRSPGVIAVDGIRGFSRKTGWDIQKGKGVQGAYLKLTTLPPGEGSIEFLAWEPEQFDDWGTFIPLLKYDPAKNRKDSANAIDIYHPSLGDVNIDKVVVSDITPFYHKGKGLYSRTVSFIEWKQPPAQDIVKSVSSTGDKGPKAGAPPDPVGNALEAETGRLLTENAATPWSSLNSLKRP